MGLGDQLMGTGMAKGAAARGKRIAFGDGKTIIWDHNSEQIFRGNPNIAPPGSERDIEWIPFYRGNRLYNRDNGRQWIWNMDFRPIPGEVYWTDQELEFSEQQGSGYIVVECNIPTWKASAHNKAWPTSHYERVARRLRESGYDVRQLAPKGARHLLSRATHVRSNTFRHALAILRNAALYIGPEGGLHHGAAAVGIPAVVLFGGFIPPQVTGYDTHTNLTGGATVFCGSFGRCAHCRAAMMKITPDDVVSAAMEYLKPVNDESIQPVALHRI